MKRLWFRSRRFGWGWQPSTPEGWLIIIFYFGFIVWNFLRIDGASHSVSDTLINFIPQTFVITLILIAVCYLTGEKPKWNME